MDRVIEIAGKKILPGEQEEILLPMPELYDGSPLNLVAHVICGKEPGPTLCLFAAIHGDELNGIEIIRRILKNKILKTLKGTLIAIPVVNVYGMLYQQRYLMDRRDLNRSFPGSINGSLASRLANLIVDNFVKTSTHIIDLHTGSLHRNNLPQIRTNIKIQEQKELASAFNAPVVLKTKERPGSLRQVARKMKVPYLLYESGEALRLDENAIKIGVNGILGVMRHLKMIDISRLKIKCSSAFSEKSVWIRAKRNALFQPKIGLGKKVNVNDVIGVVSDPMGKEDVDINSPIAGIIIGINNIPLVHEGAAIYHIAYFEKLTKKQISLLDLMDDEDIEGMMYLD